MRLIHLKDIVTLGNVFIGFLAVIFALNGNIQLACYLIPAAFIFDHMDGRVAKWTGMTNKFGKELDNMADHISYSVAPSFIIYAFYKPVNTYLAIFLGLVFLSIGTIRYARNNVYNISHSGFWIGTPRPVSAFLVAAVLGSHLTLLPYYNIISIPVVLFISFSGLSYFPFLAHYKRNFSRLVVVCLTLALFLMISSTIVTFIYKEPFLLDMLLFNILVYTFFQFLIIEKDELKELQIFIENVKKNIQKDNVKD